MDSDSKRTRANDWRDANMQAAASPLHSPTHRSPRLQQRRRSVTFAAGVALHDGDSRERLHKRNRQLNQVYDGSVACSQMSAGGGGGGADVGPRKTRRSGPAPTP